MMMSATKTEFRSKFKVPLLSFYRGAVLVPVSSITDQKR